MQNPLLYGIPIGVSSQQEFDKIMMERFLLDNLRTLQQHEMVCSRKVMHSAVRERI